MSTQRSSPGGWLWMKPGLPRGPNGRLLCRYCHQEVPVGRRTFCSTLCVDEWKIRTSPSHVRLLVYRRDHGVCAACGLDTKARRAAGSGHLWQADHIVPVAEGGGECGLENYRTLCTACHKPVTAALRKRLAKRETA